MPSEGGAILEGAIWGSNCKLLLWDSVKEKHSRNTDEPHVKVKESGYRPGVAQMVPGSLDSQIFMTFGT
jgi:hypothetical protein